VLFIISYLKTLHNRYEKLFLANSLIHYYAKTSIYVSMPISTKNIDVKA